MDTLSTPVEQAMAESGGAGTVRVLVRPNMRVLLHRVAQDKGYAVLDETVGEDGLTFLIGKGEAERKKENCMVCGGPLEYLTEGVSLTCLYCGKQAKGYVKCPQGHYVCELCHGKGAYEAVRDLAISSRATDPLALATAMMAHPSIPMLGCENALVAAASLMAALRNRKYPAVEDRDIVEAMERTQRQSISAYCGLTGVCGVPVAIGAVFSVLLGAECPRDRETSITMHAVARVVDAIANDTGPCCCKSYVWTGLVVACNLIKEYLDFRLPIHRERVVCSYFKRHPNGCQGARCGYLPKSARAYQFDPAKSGEGKVSLA